MRLSIVFAGVFALVAIACAKTTSNKTTDATDVSDALETQVTTINNATGDMNAGSGSTLAMLSPSEQRFMKEETFWQKVGSFFETAFDSSLHAVTCSTSGDVTDSGANFGGAAAFTVTRVWTNCIRDAGAFKRNGTVYLGWSGLINGAPVNSTYITNGTVLKRATSGLTMTRTSTGNYVEISGNDAANAVSSTNANQVFSWNAVDATTRTASITINETRTGKSAAGVTRFRHNITTPAALTIKTDTSTSTRTIASGSIAVEHTIAGFTVTTTFSNAVWDLSTCQPKSGSASVSVSGSRSGSGSLTFNNGTVNFSFEGASGSVTLPGC
jgi:hypothetical protein